MAKARKMNRSIGVGKREHPDTVVKMITISLGHIISERIGMETLCGIKSHTWFYGFPDDVTCSNCMELSDS